MISLSLFTHGAMATMVTGKVTGSDGEPLGFANVYVKGSSLGTTTNPEGFFKLDIPEGPCELVFRFIGYKMRIEKLLIQADPIYLEILLEKERYTLAEIKISADAEDPAYPIIRKAIENRKKYLKEVDEFACDVYIKGVQRLTRYPKSILGQEISLDQFIDTTTGIIYLSESVSRYSFKEPDKISETMLSSKVSGSNRAFSFNKASDLSLNLYENIIDAQDLNPRGIISPIAQSAFLYYKYRLDGTFMEDGRWVNRIEVIPKRKSDPVFSGYIFIQDSTWRIHSADLMITKESQLEFVDSLQVTVTYIPVSSTDDIWMTGSVNYKFIFDAFGFYGKGNFIGIWSNYDVQTAHGKKHFRGGIMKINEDANRQNTEYWEKIRPIPLTEIEMRDYEKRDSLMVVKESKSYLDSLDRVTNRFDVINLLTGYAWRSRYRKSEFAVSSILENIQFNTVEGWNAGLKLQYSKSYPDRKSWTLGARGRYGFSNLTFQSVVSARYDFKVKKFAYAMVEGGRDLFQFDDMNPVSPVINSFYSLFAEKNYLKLYSKDFAAITVGMEPLNGIRLYGQLEYTNRSSTINHTHFKYIERNNRDYTSNDPLAPDNLLPDNLLPAFKTHSALLLDVTARIRFKQEYIDRPRTTLIMGTNYPALLLGYRKGIKNIAQSDVDYDRVEAGAEYDISVGMLGKLSVAALYGNFLNRNKVYFMDATHFNGNKTFFSGFEKQRFDLLDYYQYSTTGEYYRAYAEHNFGGFILNKIPLLRKLKLNEIAGFRILHQPTVITHYEFSVGIQKLGIFRLDYAFSYDSENRASSGLLLGIKLGNN